MSRWNRIKCRLLGHKPTEAVTETLHIKQGAFSDWTDHYRGTVCGRCGEVFLKEVSGWTGSYYHGDRKTMAEALEYTRRTIIQDQVEE